VKSYKKVLPYILAVAPLVTTSCLEARTETGVVIKIDATQWYYCDKDGDKLVDYRFSIRNMGSSCVSDYIQEGDTITFNHYESDITGRSYSLPSSSVKSVNNRSYEDLYKNRLRAAAGQPKMR
jgi:hypothetical protein